MPHRSNRRRRGRKNKSKSKPKPSDIVKMIAEMDKENIDMEVKKFIVYTMERAIYGAECSNEFIIFCLSTYFIVGEQMYDTMSLIYDLPPMECIQKKAVDDFKINAGLTDKIVELIKIKTENLEHQKKFIILEMDEYSLQSDMQYNENLQCIIGLEDNGEVRTLLPANFVTIIWIHSVGGSWILPLCFIFTSTSASPEQIKSLLFKCVSKLEGIGLDVMGVVTKMRVNFYDLMTQLDITPLNPIFKVESKEVIFLFDVPQLMNITRNIMMKYKLEFDQHKTSWKHVKSLFVNECQAGQKNTKLVMQHIKPGKIERKLPRFAIETLSNSVATEMRSQVAQGKLPQAAIGTAEFIEFMDKVFDMFNSSYETTINEYSNSFKGTKRQQEFVNKIVEFFKKLKVYDGEKDCTDQVKFINGWLITIKGMMKIWDKLKVCGHPYLLTRNASCESLDKFMNIMKMPLFVCGGNPTPSEFLDIYTKFFDSSYFTADNLVKNEEFNLEEFAKKIYERVPPVKHDIGNKENTPNQSTSQSVDALHVLGLFMGK
ncbi:hypothetical protein JTB14_020087 [Gonioctena quinquepunctata]|nr:hypothetical protein JTB14_020087 [Gonioctena quinquepunctata]